MTRMVTFWPLAAADAPALRRPRTRHHCRTSSGSAESMSCCEFLAETLGVKSHRLGERCARSRAIEPSLASGPRYVPGRLRLSSADCFARPSITRDTAHRRR